MPGSQRHNPPEAPPLLAVGLLSAAVLAYEVLLMRLFAIVHWHHFAFMMISIALLGYGASGTLLALAPAIAGDRLRILFPVTAAGFSLTSVICFSAAQHVPFNALEIFWDVRQWGHLAAVYALLLVPFLLAATGIGAVLRFYDRLIPKVYAADLAGAGIGAGLTAGILFHLPPPAALMVVSATGAASAIAAAWRWRIADRRIVILTGLGSIVLTGMVAMNWGGMTINPYKPLAQILRIPETRRIYEGHHPMGWFSAIASTGVPFRHAPGLSLKSDAAIPEQVALFVDGMGMNVVDRHNGRDATMAYLKQSTVSVGLYLRPRAERVFIAGAGGGQDILRARAYGAQTIAAVDVHPFYARMLQGRLRAFSGFDYLEGQIRYHSTTVRAYLQSTADDFDIIQLPLMGDGGAGTSAFGEDTLLTIEGLGQLWQHLSTEGLMVLPLWIRLPPRSSLKAFLLALKMMEDQGIADPAEHVAVIRDWRTAVMLVGKRALSRSDRETLRQFCRQWGFDLVYLSDLRPGETNRHSVLARPFFAEGTRQLAGPERDAFVDRYKFDLRPPTDDRPFFGQFFRWQSLPEIARLRKTGGVTLLDWGYPVLVVTLLQASVFSLILIGLPVWWRRRKRAAGTGERLRATATLVYFAAIGLGFIFLEMVFIQRLSLFLHHPLLAATLTLGGFLLGAGTGSIGADAAIRYGWQGARLLPIGLAAVTAVGLVELVVLPDLINRFFGVTLGLKVLLALGLILPLAVPMGTAFPLGLAVLAAQQTKMVPWAWGINGCATVIGAIAVPLLAIHTGYAIIMGMALMFYTIGLVMVTQGWGNKIKANFI